MPVDTNTLEPKSAGASPATELPPPIPVYMIEAAAAAHPGRAGAPRVGVVQFLGGTWGVVIYWGAAAKAGIAAAEDMNVLPAILMIFLPLLVLYGVVRLFHLRWLGIGFMSDWAALGVLAVLGGVLAALDVPETPTQVAAWAGAVLAWATASWWLGRRRRPQPSPTIPTVLRPQALTVRSLENRIANAIVGVLGSLIALAYVCRKPLAGALKKYFDVHSP